MFVGPIVPEAYGEYGAFCGERMRATQHVTHHGGPSLALGREQRRFLLALYEREQQEFARWLKMRGLPRPGMVEELVVQLDEESLALKGATLRWEAPWSAMLRRLNPSGDARAGKNLARAADRLEARGLIWVKPSRTGHYRRRMGCGLTELGRSEAAREVEALSDPAERKVSRESELVEPHYRQWRARRTELERRLRDEDFVMQASDENLAILQRQLTQARVLQEFARRVLRLIAAEHLKPDPPGVTSAVLTAKVSTRESYGPIDDETSALMDAMLCEVVSQAMTEKRAARTSRILSRALDGDED